MQLPPYPGWEGLHPLVIHFPIALLLVAPILMLIGMFVRRHERGIRIAAFVLLVLGTIGAFVSVQTGKAAGEIAERTPEISVVLEHHEDLAESSLTIFTILTVFYAAIIFGPGLFKLTVPRGILTTAIIIFLIVYGAGTLILINTAHNGGRLVHEYGVQSLVGAESQPVENPTE